MDSYWLPWGDRNWNLIEASLSRRVRPRTDPCNGGCHGKLKCLYSFGLTPICLKVSSTLSSYSCSEISPSSADNEIRSLENFACRKLSTPNRLETFPLGTMNSSSSLFLISLLPTTPPP